MKKFAFPLSIKCANEAEKKQCVELLESLGYKGEDVEYDLMIITNYEKNVTLFTDYFDETTKHVNNRHHIDHFNPELIRDIAAACTNETWQKGEPLYNWEMYDHVFCLTGCNVSDYNPTEFRRPTLAEICSHHGYEIKGRDIVRKEPEWKDDSDMEKLEESISELGKAICEMFKSMNKFGQHIEIRRLEAENERLRNEVTAWQTKYEAIKEVVNR